MSYINDIRHKLQDANTLHFLTGAFAEIAAIKIKTIREAFDKNPPFFKEISLLYDAVKKSAERARHLQTVGTSPSLDRPTLYVADTSNHRFFGELNALVMRTFLQDTHTQKVDKLVIGQTGSEYIDMAGIGLDAYYFINFDNDFPSADEVRVLLGTMFQRYRRIVVYYPKFRTMFTQTVGIDDLTHTLDQDSHTPTALDDDSQLLFEPELSEILFFFETQIRYILFTRVMLESELSRMAARLFSMSAAEDRAKVHIREVRRELSKATLSVGSAQLLEAFAGIKKWKKN